MSIPHITFTRFLAALAVFIYHFAINSGNKVFPFDTHLLNELFKNGDLAVPYFFVLSGFIMSIAYFGRASDVIDVKKFYVSRFSRIYPIYIISLLLYLLASFATSKNESISIFAWIINFFLLQSWLPNSTINFAAWSLSVEVFFYILFPFLFPLLRNLSYSTLNIIVFFLIIYCIEKSYFRELYSIIPVPIIHTPVFVLGVIVGIMYKKTNDSFFLKNIENRISRFSTYAILLLIAILILSIYKLGASSFNDTIPVVIFTLIIPFLSWDKSYISILLSNKHLVFLGNISYSLYILQFPLKFWFDLILMKLTSVDYKVNSTLYFYIFFVFCLSVSTVLFYLIEEPSRKRIRHLFYSW